MPNDPSSLGLTTHFSPIYWLRSKVPVSELDGKKCLICISDGRAAVFELEARAHHHFPEYHCITARSVTYADGRKFRELLFAFDQSRANTLRPAPSETTAYDFVADFDDRVPLRYDLQIQKAVNDYILEKFSALDALPTSEASSQ